MMAAAALGEAEMFQKSFRALLVQTPEEVYQAKSEELTAAFKEIFSMGDPTATGERIAVALIKAQELGLELPPVVANFSSGQIRLQNTVNEINKLVGDIKNTCSLLIHTKAAENSDKSAVDLVYRCMHLKMTASNAKDAMAKVENSIKGYKLLTKEWFLSDITYNLDEKEFCEKYKLNNSIKGERDRLNRILRKEEYFSYNEEKYINKGDLTEAFPGLCAYVDKCEDADQKKLMQDVLDLVVKMVKERIAYKTKTFNRDYLMVRAESLPSGPEVDASLVGTEKLCVKVDQDDGKTEAKYFNSVDDIISYLRPDEAAKEFIPKEDENLGGLYDEINNFYRDKPKNKRPDKTLESKAEKLWESYEKDYLEEANKEFVKNRNEYLDALSKIFPVDSGGKMNKNPDKSFALWKATIKSITDENIHEDFTKESTKMEKEYEKCLKDSIYAEMNAKDIHDKFKNFSVKLLDNAIDTIDGIAPLIKMEDFTNNTYDGEYNPRNFLNVMGDVIDKHLGSTFMQLGVVGNYKARKLINMKELQND